ISLFFTFTMLWQQPIFSQRTISGVVSNAKNDQLLVGVKVQIPNKKKHTRTDEKGAYTIKISEKTTQLQFSFTENYRIKTVEIGSTDELNVVLEPKVLIGYGSQNSAAVTSAVATIYTDQFNQGVIADPARLLQGKVAGLQIYNRGGNPNQTHLMRIRGLSTSQFAQPLIVVDGVADANLQNVDPNDIASITILKDASAAAIYGLRGSNGVILVTTRRGVPTKKMQWTYRGQGSAESAVKPIEVLNASDFLAAGGIDLGATTDWTSEVTQQPINHNHSLAVSQGIGKNTAYRVAVNYRARDGILKNTGFQKLNTRLHFSTAALADKLQVDVHAAYAHLDQQNGYTEALRYATLFNPTAPILGEDAPFAFNSEQYGGFFETLGLFDSYNPVSIVEQNQHETRQKFLNFSTNLSYNFTDKLVGYLRLGRQNAAARNQEFAPTTALFLGNAASPTRRGLATVNERETDFSLFELFGTYHTDFADNDLQITVGTAFQRDNRSNAFIRLGDFQDNDLDLDHIDFDNLITTAPTINDAGFIEAERTSVSDRTTTAFFSRANWSLKEAIFVNASIRAERTASLPEWGLFPAIGVGIDLQKYLAAEKLDLFKVRLGYGVTSSLNSLNGLSAEIQNITFNGQNGMLNTSIINNGTEELTYERKATFNLGLEIEAGKFWGTLDAYYARAADLLVERFIDSSIFGVDRRFSNEGQLNTRGLELTLGYEVWKSKNSSYQTGLVATTYQTKLANYYTTTEMRGELGAPGQRGTNLLLLEEGTPIGTIWGPVFAGTNEMGRPVFADVNQDERLVTDPSEALSPDADFAVLGNGLPDLEMGWTNQFTFGNWTINAFFRGAFGHQLVNTFRAFYEPREAGQTAYNLINTSLAIPELQFARFSSLYVEKANFLKLDNFTIARSFAFKQNNTLFAQVTLTITNAFVLTNYTGADPEPSLVDTDWDVLVPGIDRRNTYLPARTIVLGLHLDF
ncbi:MAG: TonB-dependent receptor, partial [Bacteroidota bacterium]